MSARRLIVFAKRPDPGRVKTRMTPPLSADHAAALYAAMLADVLATSALFARSRDVEAVLAVDPPDACGVMARDVPAPFCVVAQRGPDLSARMAFATIEAAAAGCDRILLRGSDSPALEQGALDEALDALETADLVLVPDLDGGYSLVGLRRPAPGLFDHPMSTGRVLEDTLENARRLGLRARRLAPRFDLDTAEDLELLASARREGSAASCPRTLAYLDRHGLWPGVPAAR